MPTLSESLSVWDIAHRWAGYDPDTFRLRLPFLVKDYARLLFNEVIEGNLFCETLIQAKRPSDSYADPRYYIRSHLDDIYMCVWGRRYKRSLLKWAVISRHEFEDWCERYSIPLPEFWFPPGWNREFDSPWYGPRALAVYHIEPEESGDVSYGFDVPKPDEEESTDKAPAPAPADPRNLSHNQKAKLLVQHMATQLWKEHPDRTIAEMAQDKILLSYCDAGRYTTGAVRKWLRPVAPRHIKNRRGRPRKKVDIDTD